MKFDLMFSNNLKQARKGQKITQAALGKAVGVSAQTISAYENGEKQPSLDKAAAIAEELDISLDKLCGVRVSRPPLPTLMMGDIARVLVSMEFWETARFVPTVTTKDAESKALVRLMISKPVPLKLNWATWPYSVTRMAVMELPLNWALSLVW